MKYIIKVKRTDDNQEVGFIDWYGWICARSRATEFETKEEADTVARMLNNNDGNDGLLLREVIQAYH